MLADNSTIVPQSGRLNLGTHERFTSKLEIVGFIAEVLPQWRDESHLSDVEAETLLTGYLCDYLNSAARKSEVWSYVQFRTETRDETCGSRTIDLTVKPCASVFIIEGRRHSQFDALFPIECKRLPTPKGTERDEREYVINKFKTTGGIYRFKFGLHGAAHTFVAMIAYVQEQSCSHWKDQVNGWIKDLAEEPNSLWNESDILQLLSDDLETGISTLKSEHQRTSNLKKCELHHLWVKMRSPGLP